MGNTISGPLGGCAAHRPCRFFSAETFTVILSRVPQGNDLFRKDTQKQQKKRMQLFFVFQRLPAGPNPKICMGVLLKNPLDIDVLSL